MVGHPRVSPLLRPSRGYSFIARRAGCCDGENPGTQAHPRRWERRLERGGLSRIVRDRDVSPEAYMDVL
ncbi:MAG: hypothetical protein ACREQ8_08235, partial [Woeseiaceae bacterium]